MFGAQGFLRLGVSFLTFGVSNSQVWEQVLLCYVWGLVILTFGG